MSPTPSFESPRSSTDDPIEDGEWDFDPSVRYWTTEEREQFPAEEAARRHEFERRRELRFLAQWVNYRYQGHLERAHSQEYKSDHEKTSRIVWQKLKDSCECMSTSFGKGSLAEEMVGTHETENPHLRDV